MRYLAIAALGIVLMATCYMAGRQDAHHSNGLTVPAIIKTNLQHGFVCWLETDPDGSAQWYCK